MFQRLLLDLLTSKKAIAAIVGVLVAFASRWGLDLPSEAVTQIVAPIVAYILGQGIADAGKEAVKAETRPPIT